MFRRIKWKLKRKIFAIVMAVLLGYAGLNKQALIKVVTDFARSQTNDPIAYFILDILNLTSKTGDVSISQKKGLQFQQLDHLGRTLKARAIITPEMLPKEDEQRKKLIFIQLEFLSLRQVKI